MAQLLAEATTTLLAAYLQVSDGGSGIPWWVWVTLVAILLLLLLIGFVRQSEPGEPLPKPEEHAAAPAVVGEESSQGPAPEPESIPEEPAVAGDQGTEAGGKAAIEVEQTQAPVPAPDDLKRIEGIGPKISTILNENGVATYAALAAADPERLQEILDEAGIRLADPATWPEQARLAADGQWAELDTLQDNLKGGREE